MMIEMPYDNDISLSKNWEMKKDVWIQNNTRQNILCINTLRLRQKGCHYPNNIFKCIFFNENIWIWIKIPLKFVPVGSMNNIPALVQIMTWRRPGDKPLSEPMMVSSQTHICVTRPQWVNCKQRDTGEKSRKPGFWGQGDAPMDQHNKGSISLMIISLQKNSNSIEILPCWNSFTSHQITTNFCTCHYTAAVVHMCKIL